MIKSFKGIPFKKIGTSIGRVLFFSPADEAVSYKKTLCLSIEKGEICAVVGFRLLSKIKIKGLKKYPQSETTYPSPDFLASCLALARAELGAEGCQITLVFPKAWAIIKTVTFPSSVLENLSDVISYELDRITPFTPETAYYDFKTLKEEDGRVTILVAAVRTDFIDPYLKALHEKGAKVNQLSINLLGLGTLCRYMNKTPRSLFIQINENQYEGANFLSETDPEVFSGFFATEDEKTKIQQISREIESLSLFLQAKDWSRDTVFYLKDKSPSLKEGIKLEIGPVKFLEESDLGFGSMGWEQKQIPYAAIGGILESLWSQALGLNLCLKGFHTPRKLPWGLSLILILVLGLLAGIYWAAPIGIEKKRLQNLEKQIAIKKTEMKKIEGLKKDMDTITGEINLIHDFKQSKPLGLDILKEVTLVLPKDAWLTRFRISDSQVNLEGYASSATLIIPRLEASKLFKKVEFAAPTFKDIRQNKDRFQIKMELEGHEYEKK